MPYGYDRNPIDPYLRPMYPVAIEGIKDANAQEKWDQSQTEDKRRWEANRPFVDAQAKQMQFVAKKAEDGWNLYNSLNGGQGDGKLASLGIKPEEYTRAYLGISARDPEIEAELPGIGKARVPVSKYLDFLTHQKQAEPMTTVMFQGRPLQVRVKDAHHYKDPYQSPPPLVAVQRVGSDGKVFIEWVRPREGMRVDDVSGLGNKMSGSGGDPSKQLLYEARVAFLHGRATPAQMALIGKDKDPNLEMAMRMAQNDPQMFKLSMEDPDAFNRAIETKAEMLRQSRMNSTGQAPPPQPTVQSPQIQNNDPLGIRRP